MIDFGDYRLHGVGFVLVLEVLYLFYIYGLSLHSLKSLARRLEGYAIASNLRFEGNNEEDVTRFAILLGTLKKIEGKQAILTGIITVAVTISTAGLTALAAETQNGTFGTNDMQRSAIECLLLMFLCSLALPLWFSFNGMRQIDQWDFWYLRRYKDDRLPEKMVEVLGYDLLDKETAFRFAKNTIRLSFSLFIFGVVIVSIWPDLASMR